VVADPKLATAGLSLSEKNLKLLFGNVPTGTQNTLAQLAAATSLQDAANETEVKNNKQLAAPQTTDTPSKQMGVPGGKGIILKSQPK
jgi:hypothetical protein